MMTTLDNSMKNLSKNLRKVQLNGSTNRLTLNALDYSTKKLSGSSNVTHLNSSTKNHLSEMEKNFPRNSPTTNLNSSTKNHLNDILKNLPRNLTVTPLNNSTKNLLEKNLNKNSSTTNLNSSTKSRLNGITRNLPRNSNVTSLNNSTKKHLSDTEKNLHRKSSTTHLNNSTKNLIEKNFPRNSSTTNHNSSTKSRLSAIEKNLPKNLTVTPLNNSTKDHLSNMEKNIPRNSLTTNLNISTKIRLNDISKNLPRNLTVISLNNLTNNPSNDYFNSTETQPHHESILTSATSMIIKRTTKSQPKPQQANRPRHSTWIFTKAEKSELESNFRLNHNPDSTKIAELATKFDKLPKQIRSWFYVQKRKRENQMVNREPIPTAHAPTSETLGSKTKLDSFCSNCPHCVVQAPQGSISVNHPSSSRSKSHDPKCHFESTSTANASTNESLVESNSILEPIIFCTDCPTYLAQQNTDSINPVQTKPPSPIPTIDHPNHLTPQSPSSSCLECKSSSKFLDPDNLNPLFYEQMSCMMHIPWSTTHPLMDNWPDFSDLYRKMDHNLDRFLNDLI